MASAWGIAVVAASFIVCLLELSSSHPIGGEADGGSRTPFLTEAPCTSGPLGMQSGAIPDSSLSASSSYSSSYLPPKARLNVGTDGWVPRPHQNQWFQVDLGDLTAVTGLIVQGHSGGRHYVSTFTVQYSNTGESEDWLGLIDAEGHTLQLNGNAGDGQQVTVTFPEVLMTRYIRILPTAWSAPTYRLKFEILGCRDGIVRLVDGDDALSGRVEIYHHDAWGAVCDEDWDFKGAAIVCSQLGFLEALEAKRGSFFGESELPIVMSRVSCKGTEKRLADCPFVCTSPRQCNNSREAGVICKPNSIRLVGGPNRTSGRVEVHKDGNWGTICDNDWDLTDASVLCRQLGFSDAEEATTGAHFGQGEGQVILDGVACSGSESKITDCPSFCWERTQCNHTQDAGVVCHEGNLAPSSDVDHYKHE
ncbi:scavenger receptor cysteine-rich domain-containing group B protein-like [Acanthaster planci]|uniref:Scavenger receptor cysteine-rich domain-containing group B protein-like n=1 Tax=Acanthaster planci TaxID=133434 RepID=A0A8B7Z2Z1_ACAPL|nr:scavenger receptor cysteine-rich domain-containing group B protein-like [Acanthaster planci]